MGGGFVTTLSAAVHVSCSLRLAGPSRNDRTLYLEPFDVIQDTNPVRLLTWTGDCIGTVLPSHRATGTIVRSESCGSWAKSAFVIMYSCDGGPMPRLVVGLFGGSRLRLFGSWPWDMSQGCGSNQNDSGGLTVNFPLAGFWCVCVCVCVFMCSLTTS